MSKYKLTTVNNEQPRKVILLKDCSRNIFEILFW